MYFDSVYEVQGIPFLDDIVWVWGSTHCWIMSVYFCSPSLIPNVVQNTILSMQDKWMKPTRAEQDILNALDTWPPCMSMRDRYFWRAAVSRPSRHGGAQRELERRP